MRFGFWALGVVALLWVGAAGAQQPVAPSAAASAQGEQDTQEAQDAQHAAPSDDGAPERVRVGYAGSAPFVIGTGDQPRGLSIKVWQDVALEADLDYELVARSTVGTLIDDVERGDLDVAVGPISITAARAERVDFTQPYFQAPLTILAHEEGTGPWARIAPFLSRAFLMGITALLGVLLLVGLVVWAVEHKKNPEQFPEHPVPGIGNGIWFALVTMTTVGYGDRVPVTLGGRIVAGVWMVIALITASSLTAGIATALTLSQLDPLVVERAGELSGKRVAVVRDTTGARFARDHGARAVETDSLNAAVQLLAAREVAAVVFDRPALEYYLSQHPELDVRLSPMNYEPLGYGFAIQRDDELRHRLNVALLETAESGQLEDITQRWLGGGE